MIARVRPVTKEDGDGPEASNAVTFDPDDDSVIHLLHKGKPVSFELDKVFSPRASQQDVSVALRWGGEKGRSSGERGTQMLTRKGTDGGGRGAESRVSLGETG